jgi:hypothetical protein
VRTSNIKSEIEPAVTVRRRSLRLALLGGIAVLPLAAAVVLPTQAAWAQSVGQTITSGNPSFTNPTGTIVSGTQAGVLNATTGATLTNNGTITGTDIIGFGVSNPGGDSFTSLTNNAGGSISGSADGIENGGTITTLTNNFDGSIMGGDAAISNGGTITTLNNSGTLSGDNIGISNTATIGALSNSDTVLGSIVGIQNFHGTITTLSNNTGGTISGGTAGIKNTDNGAIVTLSNSGTIMAGVTGNGIQNFDGASIGTLSNSGIISGGKAGIANVGTITTLTNNTGGTLTGGNTGIANSGTIGTLTNSGTIEGSAAAGIQNGSSSGSGTEGFIATLNNTIGGLISGAGAAIRNDEGTITTLSNFGTIMSSNGDGINNDASIGTLSNSGIISGRSSGIFNDEGTIAALTNSGTITGGDTGIFNENGSIGTLSNSGTITGNGFAGIQNGSSSGSGTEVSITTLTNSGTIMGGTIGIDNFGFIGTLSNTIGTIGGVISGGHTGILNEDGSTIAALTNSGTITGGTNGIGIENTGSIGMLSNAAGGIISGKTALLSTSGNLGTISNSGVISGNIDLENQTFVTLIGGSGSSVGTITGGTFSITNGGTVGTIVFTGGNELVTDDIFGDVDNETNSLTVTGTVSGGTVGVTNNGGAGSSVDNTGTIAVSGTGINNTVSAGTVTNSGHISGALKGISNTGDVTMLSNSGSIIGAKTGISNNGGTVATLSNTGVINSTAAGISNSGSVGTLTNSGTITSTITLDPGVDNTGSISALDNTGTIAAQTAIFSNNFLGPITNSGLIDGNISITGQPSVTIDSGAGTTGTIVSSDFNVGSGNEIDFDSGSQIVDANINGNVLVGPDATLLPNGSVSGSVTVEGTYEVNLAGTTAATGGGAIAAGQYSNLQVSGGFEIDTGAALDVGATDGFRTAIGQTFTIVSATGGVSGTFSNGRDITTNGFINGTGLEVVSDTGDDIVLEVIAVTPTISSFDLAAANRDALSAAHVLDSLHLNNDPTAAQSELIAVADDQTSAQLPHFLSGLDGQIFAAMEAVASQGGQALADSVSGHLGEASGDTATGPQFWDNASTQFGSRGGDSSASGLSSNVTQNTTGLDFLANGADRLGFGYSYTSTSVESGGASDSGSENAGFVYGQVAAGGYLLNGIASYGASTSSTQRANPLGGAMLKTKNVGGSDVLVSLGLSRPFTLQGLTLAPYGRVTFQQVSEAGASEGASAAALSVDSFAGTGVRSMIGLTGGSQVTSPLDAPYTYQFNAGLGEDAGNLLNPSVTETLAGVGMSVAAPKVSSTFGQLSVSGTLRMTKSAYAYANLFGEARGNGTEAGISAGLRLQF